MKKPSAPRSRAPHRRSHPSSVATPPPPRDIAVDPARLSWRSVAVIDIGTTSIRMTVAQIDQQGGVRTLESLQQVVSIGKDTFTKGSIQKPTIEESIRALQSFRRVLDEHDIRDDSRIRAVAGTAVCEAENRNAFLDRVYIATGIKVEPIDEVDATRLTYLGVRPLLETVPILLSGNVLIIEVGGGSTQVEYLERGMVVFSQDYRLGSLRLREMLDAFRAPVTQRRELMESQIDGMITHIKRAAPLHQPLHVVALGNDARFAASILDAQWDPHRVSTLSLATLTPFTEHLLPLSVNEIVRSRHVSFADAETLGPALLSYVRLAKALRVREVGVADVSMRQGLLVELAQHGLWAGDFRDQIIASTMELCRKYLADQAHSMHVAYLAKVIFDALRAEHRMGQWYDILLNVAGLLHDIGSFVSPREHHKHSMYLIMSSHVFGLNKRDQVLVALVARYHRRASPRSTHIEYGSLERERRVAVVKLAAILRVADALDRSQSQRVRDIVCSREEDRFVITVPRVQDLALEQLALQNKGGMFEEVYGLKVVLRTVSAQTL